MATPTIKRNWGLVVELTHRAIVPGIFASALFTEEGSGAGYALAAILTLRLLGGVIRPAEARLHTSPSRSLWDWRAHDRQF